MTVGDRSSQFMDKKPKNAFQKSKIFQEITNLRVDSWRRVSELIAGGERVDVVGEYNEGFLHMLGSSRPDDTVPYAQAVAYVLADAGIDVNAKDLEGNTPLHIAALNDVHHSFANTLIKLGADPCVLNAGDQDAMDLAYDPRTRDVLEYFEPGLWRATVNGEQEQVERLVKSWCKVDLKQNGKKLVKVAEDADGSGIVECLKRHRSNIRLVHAALAGKVDEVKELLKKDKVDPHTKDWSYLQDNGGRTVWPLLAECIKLGVFECAKVIMKKVSVNTMVEPLAGVSLPVYLWALDYVGDADDSFKVALFNKADWSHVDNQLDLMFKLWRKNVPSSVLEDIVSHGWDLSQRDENGYTLRDLIFMETIDLKRDHINDNLLFVDRVILNMAKNGDTKGLEKLALNGYEYLVVYDEKAKSTVHVAQKNKQKDTVKFLKKLPKLQRDAFELHKFIEVANLQATKELLDERMARVRDRAGRNALHKAVLFEKHFITKHIIDEYPALVNEKDSHGRTPLHYACCLQQGGALEEMLMKRGADEALKDELNQTPMDYKLQGRQDFTERERVKDYGTHVYLLERYMSLCGAILDADADRLRQIVEALIRFNLNDFGHRLSEGAVRGLDYRPLLFLCLDCGQYDMAMYLMDKGADCRIPAEVTTENGRVPVLPLIDFAAMLDQYELVEFIKTKLELYNRDPDSAPAPSSRHGSGRSQVMSDRSTSLSHYERMDTDESLSGHYRRHDNGHVVQPDHHDNEKPRTTSSACIIL